MYNSINFSNTLEKSLPRLALCSEESQEVLLMNFPVRRFIELGARSVSVLGSMVSLKSVADQISFGSTINFVFESSPSP